MGIYACPRCGNPNGWWSGNMQDVHECPNPPRPVPGLDFTPEEARRGYAMRNGVQTYCCYGMYCDVGHSNGCKYASGVRASHGETFSTPPSTSK